MRLLRHSSRYRERSIMAKRGNSVIGIDLGKHVFKGVLLQRRGDARYVLTSFASREVPENLGTVEDLAQQLKLLFQGYRRKRQGLRHRRFPIPLPCSALSSSQTRRSTCFAMPCASTASRSSIRSAKISCSIARLSRPTATAARPRHANGEWRRTRMNGVAKKKYLVGGMLRPTVKQITDAMSKARISADILQLAPVCSFNAFEFAYPQIFANDTFLLLDMGHLQSTVLIGSKKELVLVRSIDYGGKSLIQALIADGAVEANAAQLMMNEGDAGHGGDLPRFAHASRHGSSQLDRLLRGTARRKHSSHFRFRRPRPHGAILQTLSDELEPPLRDLGPARDLRSRPAGGQAPGAAERICLPQCRLRRGVRIPAELSAHVASS